MENTQLAEILTQNANNVDIPETKSKESSRTLAIGLIVSLALVAVALCFAEVKWGFLSASLTWMITNPLIVGSVLTILVLGGVSYLVFRSFQGPAPKAREIPESTVDQTLGSSTLGTNHDGQVQGGQEDSRPQWLQELEEPLSRAHAQYLSIQWQIELRDNTPDPDDTDDAYDARSNDLSLDIDLEDTRGYIAEARNLVVLARARWLEQNNQVAVSQCDALLGQYSTS